MSKRSADESPGSSGPAKKVKLKSPIFKMKSMQVFYFPSGFNNIPSTYNWSCFQLNRARYKRFKIPKQEIGQRKFIFTDISP